MKGQKFIKKEDTPTQDFKKSVGTYINSCIADGGSPTFRTKYAGKPYPDKNILGMCAGGKGVIEGVWFNNIPEEDLKKMESGTGDWKWLKEKYDGGKKWK